MGRNRGGHGHKGGRNGLVAAMTCTAGGSTIPSAVVWRHVESSLRMMAGRCEYHPVSGALFIIIFFSFFLDCVVHS